MRLVLTISLALVVFCLPSLPSLAAGDINVLIGQGSSGEGLFDEADVDDSSQFGAALTFDFGRPVMLAVDLLRSSADGRVDVPALYPTLFLTDVETTELDVGIRMMPGSEKTFKPYFGGGLAWVRLDISQILDGSFGTGSEFIDTIMDDAGSSIGVWANAGLLYRAGQNFNIGVDVRYSDADVDLRPVDGGEGLKFKSGRTQYSLVLGYHW